MATEDSKIVAQNYSQQDFSSTYEEILSIVESSTTKWHPRTSTEADPGVAILKAFAFFEDKSNYRFDMSLNQAYLDGVCDKQSAYELLKELGYLMKQARAATGKITLTPTSADSWSSDDTSKEIPIFTLFTDATNTLRFFATESLIINRPTDSDEWATQHLLNVQAGEPFQISKDGNTYFTLKDIDEQGRLYLGKSGLAQNGVFVLTRGTYTDSEGSEQEILVKDWTYLDYAILKPAGMWYMVETADSGEMYVQFPSNFDSLLADRQIVVYATYTDGAASNVAKGLISRFVDDASWRAYFAVAQPAAFYTGQDEESIELATKHYYETKDVCNTLVSASDYVAALKNLVISATFAGNNLLQGDNYLSNAVVRTAADRKTKIATISYGTEYQLFVPDTTKPSNQIDVTAMTPYASASSGASEDDYNKGFRVMSSTGALRNSFVDDFGQQLQNNTAVDVDLAVTDIGGDLASQRLLAVTTPQVTVRMSSYTDAAAIQLKSKIQNYFYTTYAAKNLTPGVRLDVQKIIDDIKALSPSIVSVSVADLDYTIYQKYQQVDGVADVRLSVEPDLNDSYVPQATLSSTAAVANLQKEILALSVLQGSVPLYKYLNRQNTKSKESYVYSIAAGSSAEAAAEHVNFVPINASSYMKLNSGGLVNPKITSIHLPSYDSANSDGYYYYPLFYENQIVQFRKPATIEKASYGFGTKYEFTRLRAHTGGATLLTRGTYVTTNSKITVKTTEYSLPTKHNEFSASVSGDYTTYTAQQAWYLLQTIACVSETDLNSGSKVAPGSLDENGDPLFDVSETIQDGQEYTLTEGEVLTIKKSSDGSTVVELGPGDIIQPSGIALSATNGSDSSTLMTSQSISVLGLDVTPYGTEYKYFLSTNGGSITWTIDGSDKTYMLEENELFIIADKGVTEYITFGPGTLLKAASGLTLVASNLITLEEVSQAMFELLPGEVSVQAFEFDTYLQYSVIRSTSVDSSNNAIVYSDSWASISSGSVVRAYSNVPLTSDTTKDNLPGLVADIDSYKDYSSPWQYRRLFSLVSDSNGLAVIQSNRTQDGRNVYVEFDDNSELPENSSSTSYGYVSSSVPFSFLSAASGLPSGGAKLLSFGVASAYVSTGAYLVVGSNQLYKGVNIIRTIPAELVLSFDANPDNLYIDIDSDEYLCSFQCPNLSASRYAFALSFSNSLGSTAELGYAIGATTGTLSFTKGGWAYFTFEGDLVSNTTSITFTCSEAMLKSFAGNTLRIYNFSAIDRYASELGIDSAVLTSDSFSTLVATLDTEGRFNYAAYPTEAFSYPLSADSFFASEHPANSHVFPYINWKSNEIRILSSRS